MSDPDFDPIVAVFRQSAFVRAVRATISAVALAWDHSPAVSRIGQFLDQPMRSEQRVVAIGLAMTIAALAHLAIREVLPPYSASGLPWWWNAAIAAIGLAVAALAGSIAAAWPASMPARLWHGTVRR